MEITELLGMLLGMYGAVVSTTALVWNFRVAVPRFKVDIILARHGSGDDIPLCQNSCRL